MGNIGTPDQTSEAEGVFVSNSIRAESSIKIIMKLTISFPWAHTRFTFNHMIIANELAQMRHYSETRGKNAHAVSQLEKTWVTFTNMGAPFKINCKQKHKSIERGRERVRE